jgi:integrase
MIQTQVKPRSHAKFEQVIRLHVLPVLGRVALAKLSDLQIQELIASKVRAGMAPQSAIHLRNTLRNAFNRAIRLRMLSRNPAASVEAPRLPDRRVDSLSPLEAERLLATAKESRLATFYVLALATGARRGELLGLRWGDVELDRGRLTITRALQRVEKHGLQITETKSRSACRTVVLPKFAVASLRAHHTQQLHERLVSGPDWRNKDGLIFTGRDGQPLEPIQLHRDFKRVLKRAGLRSSTRIHDLRHSTATLLLAKGIPLKLIQDLLGHSSIAVTSAFYAHVAEELREQAATAMDGLFTSAS